MTPLKRKDSCTFKRETPLEVQERIYPLPLPGGGGGKGEREHPPTHGSRPRMAEGPPFSMVDGLKEAVGQVLTPRPGLGPLADIRKQCLRHPRLPISA